MTSEKRPKYGPRIAILTVLLAGILGLALNVDALLGPPPEPVEEAVEEAVEPPAAGAPESGTDFDMEQHIAKVVLEKATVAMLEHAATGLPALPEEWTPKDLQVDDGYVEDEDEAEYYEELDQLGTVLKNSAKSERAALSKLFEKPKSKAAPTPKVEPRPQPKAKTLALRPSAALIKKKTASSRKAPSSGGAKTKKKARPEAVAAAAPAEAKADPPAAAPATPAPTINPNATAKELISLGRKLLMSGDPSGAEKVYRKALEKGPSSARARYGLAKALYQRGRTADAMTELQRILSRNKNHGSALLMMGSLLQEQGRSGEARKHYQRYLDSHPNGRRADEIRSILARL